MQSRLSCARWSIDGPRTSLGEVIQLLDELKGKVEADLAAEEKMMEESAHFYGICDHRHHRGFITRKHA